MKRIAVVCSPGVGDGVIFHIASHHLQKEGYDVTTFNDHLAGFGGWLRGFKTAPRSTCLSLLKDFDEVLLQHGNDPLSYQIQALDLPVSTFYGSYRASKHGPFHEERDYLCNLDKPMVANVLAALQKLFKIRDVSGANGMVPPPGLIHHRHPKRVALHPLSGDPDRNWPREKFARVAEWLTDEGYEPTFLVPPAELSHWEGPKLPNLEALTSWIYESGFFIGNDSGPGHIASFCRIPHLIIGREERHMRHWRPGWLLGAIITPPSWVPNWKGLRLRDKYWKSFISNKMITNSLKSNVLK